MRTLVICMWAEIKMNFTLLAYMVSKFGLLIKILKVCHALASNFVTLMPLNKVRYNQLLSKLTSLVNLKRTDPQVC